MRELLEKKTLNKINKIQLFPLDYKNFLFPEVTASRIRQSMLITIRKKPKKEKRGHQTSPQTSKLLPSHLLLGK